MQSHLLKLFMSTVYSALFIQPVELAEGVRGQVSVIEQVEHVEETGLRRQQSARIEAAQTMGTGKPLVGEELASLLDRISELPYIPHVDGRTDISTHHENILYPNDGQMP